MLQKTRQPFNTNGIAQAGALASLDDERAPGSARATLTDEGAHSLRASFRELGLEYVPSAANFVLVQVGHGKEVFRALLRTGVIVRDMDAYGLPEWIRVSVGTAEQNRRFLAELRRVLRRAGSRHERGKRPSRPSPRRPAKGPSPCCG